MATNTTRFEATLDTSKFTAGVKKLESGAKNAFNNIASFGEKVFFGFQGLQLAAQPLKKLVDASNELATAQRKLDAASRLTGTSLDFLKTTAGDIQERFQLTTTQANEFVVTANKLAVASGDVSKTGEVLNRLFDLAAGQGLNASEALQRFDQAIKGVDEGTEALFSGKNPIDLYNTYAASIGTTAGKLTEMQKKQAILNQIIGDGTVLQGEYNKFLASAQGQQQQLATVTEQFSAKLGDLLNKYLTPLLDVAITVLDFLADLNPAVIETVSVLGLLAVAASKFGIAFKAMLGPIGLTIAGLTALYFAYQDNLFGIQDFTKSAIAYLSAFVSSAQLAFTGFVQIFNTAVAGIKDIFKNLWAELASGNFDFIDVVKTQLTANVDTIADIWTNTTSQIKDNFANVSKEVQQEYVKSAESATQSASAIVNANNAITNSLVPAVAASSKLAFNYSELADSINKSTGESLAFRDSLGEQDSVVGSILESSTKLFEENQSKIKGYLEEMVVTVEEKGAQLAYLAAEIGALIGNSIAGAIIGTKDSLKEGLKQILLTVLSFIQRLVLAAQTAAGIEALLGNPLALLKVAGVQAAFEALKVAISSFAVGVENFGGGLAYVHSGELVQLPRGTNVYTKAETQNLFRQQSVDMTETNDLLRLILKKEYKLKGADLSQTLRRDSLKRM